MAGLVQDVVVVGEGPAVTVQAAGRESAEVRQVGQVRAGDRQDEGEASATQACTRNWSQVNRIMT